jgi:ribosome-associated protein
MGYRIPSSRNPIRRFADKRCRILEVHKRQSCNNNKVMICVYFKLSMLLGNALDETRHMCFVNIVTYLGKLFAFDYQTLFLQCPIVMFPTSRTLLWHRVTSIRWCFIASRPIVVYRPLLRFNSSPRTDQKDTDDQTIHSTSLVQESEPLWIKKAILGRDVQRPTEEVTRKDEITVQDIVDFLHKEKAQNILTISLEDSCPFADYMIISEALSSRHLTGMAESLLKYLRVMCPGKLEQFRMDGRESKGWVIVSTGDIMVHFFMPETRNFYQLEKLWGSAAQGIDRDESQLSDLMNYLKSINYRFEQKEVKVAAHHPS